MLVARSPFQPAFAEFVDTPEHGVFDAWEILDPQLIERPIPFVLGDSERSRLDKDLMEITIPFLSKVPLSLYVRVLEDEHLLIGSLRLALRETSKNLRETNAPHADVVNDILRPRIDALELKIKQLSARRSLAGVSYMAVGPISLASFAMTGYFSAIMGLGAGAFTMKLTDKVLSDLKERHELQQDPMYILWRLRKLQRIS